MALTRGVDDVDALDRVTGLDLDGNEVSFEADEYLARVPGEPLPRHRSPGAS